jgi:hypothetical protein
VTFGGGNSQDGWGTKPRRSPTKYEFFTSSYQDLDEEADEKLVRYYNPSPYTKFEQDRINKFSPMKVPQLSIQSSKVFNGSVAHNFENRRNEPENFSDDEPAETRRENKPAQMRQKLFEKT